MIVLIQFFDILNLFLPFILIDMIEVKYIFLLTRLYQFRQITERTSRSISLAN